VWTVTWMGGWCASIPMGETSETYAGQVTRLVAERG